MKKVYYVVYEAYMKGESMGKGNVEIGPIEPITNIEQIKIMEDVLKNDKPLFVENDVNILILSYQELREE